MFDEEEVTQPLAVISLDKLLVGLSVDLTPDIGGISRAQLRTPAGQRLALDLLNKIARDA